MPRLPIPGSDDNTWGDILNSFLEVSIYNNPNNASDANNGTLNANSVGTAQLQANSVTIGKLSASGSASSSTYLRGDGSWGTPGGASNATTSSAGIVQLAGDLGGTSTSYSAPTLASTSNVNSIISANTTVAGALQKTDNLASVSDTGSSRANLHIPELTPAAACGIDIGGTYTAPSNGNGATFSPFSGNVDSYFVQAGDLVLLVNEAVNNITGSTATAAANGLWQVVTSGASGQWVRPTEFASGLTVKGRNVTVMGGAANSGPWYLKTPTAGIVVDTSSQTWQQATGTWQQNFDVIAPSGDSTGATDVATINTALTAGKNVLLIPGGTYYINAPITPISKSFITGFQWNSASQEDNYGSGQGGPTGAVIQAVNFTGKAMILMENDTTTQYYGVDISGLSLISYGGGMPSTSHGIAAYGYWGACFLRGVKVEKPGADCLHFDASPSVANSICDDWQITDCKFSGSRNGYGVNIATNLPDSWFDNCESSQNALDGWAIGWGDNTRFSNCKGENNLGVGWHFISNGTDHLIQLSNCTSQLNAKDGWLFEANTSGEYLLMGCRSHNDNTSNNAAYAAFRSNGSRAKIIGTGCYGSNTTYGVYEGNTSYGMWFTGSYFSGTTAATYDDGTNTNKLVNQSPAFGSAPSIVDGVTVSGTPSSGQAIVATSATAAGWSTVPTSAANTFTGNQTAPAFIASGLTGATASSRYVGATASGAPSSGTFAIGDYVIDQTGAMWICTAAGTPGTWAGVGGGSITASSTTTFTNKRITKRIATLTDAATVTPATDSYDGGVLNSLSQSTNIANPTGTPTDAQQYLLRITSSSTQTLSWGNSYRGSTAISLPTATSGSNATDYIGFSYNLGSTSWDLIAYVPGV